MIDEDHVFLVEKIGKLERTIEEYDQCFLSYIDWFNKHKKHLKKIPAKPQPRLPWTYSE